MPPRIHPLPFAKHEYLGDAAALLGELAAILKLIRVVGVHNSGRAIDLNLGFWKLQLDKLTAAFCELSRSVEDRVAVSPVVIARLDRDGLFRDQFFKRRPIIREVRSPDGFSGIEQPLLHSVPNRTRYLVLLLRRFRMKLRIAAGLNPLAILPGVKIRDSKSAFRWTVWRVRLDIRDEAYKSRIPFKDHVELAHLVAFHSVRTGRVDVDVVHITVDAMNHGARAFQVAQPVLVVRGAQCGGVFLDKGLENTV